MANNNQRDDSGGEVQQWHGVSKHNVQLSQYHTAILLVSGIHNNGMELSSTQRPTSKPPP
jgi:hypothetical protein